MLTPIQEQQRLVNLRREDARKKKQTEIPEQSKQEQPKLDRPNARFQVERLVYSVLVFDEKGQLDGNKTHSVRTELQKLYIHNLDSSVNWSETLNTFEKYLEMKQIRWAFR